MNERSVSGGYLSKVEISRKLRSEAIYRAARIMQIPVTASFELTARCNFHCRMCYVCRLSNDRDAMQKELTAEQWIRLGEEARDEGLYFLTLTGGEIFLRKDFRQIYEELSNMGFRITLYTNGSMITDETAKWLKRIPPALVSVTMYGASPGSYEIITGHRDGFERTMRGIRALMDNGIRTEIKTTVVKANQNEFEDLVRIADQFGLMLGLVNYVSARREGVGTDPLTSRLTPLETVLHNERFEEYIENFLLKNRQAGDQTQNMEIIDDWGDPRTDPSDSCPQHGNAFRCTAGHSACWFTWDGFITPCAFLPVPAVNVLEKPFKEAWDELKVKCNEVPKCRECEECDMKGACKTCPGRLYSETGSFERKADYLCELAKCKTDLMKKCRS